MNKYIDEYLIEVDFPVDKNFIELHKRKFVEAYNNFKSIDDEYHRAYHSYQIKDDILRDICTQEDYQSLLDFNTELSRRFNGIVHDIFEVDDPNPTDFIDSYVEQFDKKWSYYDDVHLTNWIYVQSSKLQFNKKHHHQRNGTSIAGTIYFDVPSEGGELAYYLYKDKKYKVKENKLYLFPGWMFHNPTRQNSTVPRICINMEYVSRMRPLDKEKKIFW